MVRGLNPDRSVGYVESKIDISWKKTGCEKLERRFISRMTAQLAPPG